MTTPAASPAAAPPHRDIAGARAAHRRLETTLHALVSDGTLDDPAVRRPSSLPGWSIGHVLAHLARNADSHLRLIEAAARGEIADQYPGGAAGRADEIERDAGRPVDEQVADLEGAQAALERGWDAAPGLAWAGEGRSLAGPVPIADLAFRRWRETEVHHVDLGLGRTHDDWPAEYVRLELGRMEMLWAARRPMGLASLPAEALAVPTPHRLAWLLGRATIDGLEPAGIF